MTSPSRVLAILGLFTKECPIWHTDEINERMGYSRATGYRYVKDLVDAGFLQKVSAGHYALGARIIELDYQLRQSDPVLLAAAPIMDALAARVRLDAVLSAMLGAQVVDVHRASRDSSLHLAYGRGRPRPLFQGAAPNILMACLPRAGLLRLYRNHAREIDAAGLGSSWDSFRKRMAEFRAKGMYLSLGEVEPGVGAAAVGLLNAEGEVAAALSLVGTVGALTRVGEKRLHNWLRDAADKIQERLTSARRAADTRM